jgi:hypothetical protein
MFQNESCISLWYLNVMPSVHLFYKKTFLKNLVNVLKFHLDSKLKGMGYTKTHIEWIRPPHTNFDNRYVFWTTQYICHKIQQGKKFSVCLIKHHVIKTYWRSGGIAPSILWPRLWMEVSGQLHAPALYPQGRVPGTHWIGDWVGPRAVLDTVSKRKIPSPRRKSNPH